MKKTHMQQALAALLASSALCAAGAAQAQDAAAQAPVTETTATNPEQPVAEQAAEQDPNQLEAIVVTAQRRSEQLQDVPISITAVTAATLERAGVDDTQALSMVTPGLQLTNVRAAVVPFLRGVGTANITAGDEGATAIYVDGILNPVAAANVFALNNVERVEVLRGPQGTLFGRNAVGGLINIITRDPSPRFKGNVEIGYGNYETLFGNAYVTGPLADNVAADLAFYGYHQGEGWGHNHFLDRDQNRNREFAVRSKVKIDLTPDTTLTLAGDYALANSDIGSTRQPLPGAVSTGGLRAQGDIYDSYGDVPPKGRKEQYGGSIKLQHDFGGVDFQSSSAYRKYDVLSHLDSDGTSLQVFDVRDTTKVDTFQQEFLLTGSLGKLDFTTGLFYFYSLAKYDPIILRSTVIPTNNIRFDDQMETNSYAVFGQATYHLTDTTRITGGLRYTYDTRKVEGIITSLPGFPTPPGPGRVIGNTANLPESQTDRSFDEITWRGVIDQDIGENVLAFASISRGFKSGVFSLTAPTAPAVEPEILDAYEVGFKADLLNNTLRINASAFYYEYKNIQMATIGGQGTPILLNAAEGEFKGVDGEIVWIAPVSTGNLQFRGSFAYLDGEYSSYPGALFYDPLPQGGNRGYFGDATGNEAVQAPEFTSSLTVDYQLPLASGSTLGTNWTWSYNSGFWWDAQNRVEEPSFHLVNGEVSYTTPDEAWGVRLFVRNLFDEKRYLFKSIGVNGDTGAAHSPRTYGIAVSRKF